ncbi:MAG: hypothetical protein M1827_005653 [Pycnora praestabilis]|nr:MAG: hypothetical protein M1827_005653 [Pycnora praestabilis]
MSEQYHQTISRQQNARATAQLEDEIEEEVNAQEPPSDTEIRQQTESGPITRFQELADRGLVSAQIIRNITEQMKLSTMTQVQSMTINEALQGADVLAQARTGTGKTLGFLIPVLQNIISHDPKLAQPARGYRGARTTSDDIRAIIISPTRELAEQIATEAQRLVQNTGVVIQTAVGGTMKNAALRQMQRNGCHILVGTPGRLQDILSDPRSGVSAPKIRAFVLDEADRLLDQGFSVAIQDIQDLLPSKQELDRQTLLFSATVPDEVMQLIRETMKRDFHFVQGVQGNEEPTHAKVPQKIVAVRGFENFFPALLELCKKEIQKATEANPFKAIVYFASTAEVHLASDTFRNLRTLGFNISSSHQHPLYPAKIYEIHAKLTQAQRTTAAESFRRAKSGILFSSDVTARGMDFPNVTHVIQIGLPVSRDQYIHRIGRTGRGDKSGEGWLLVSDLEQTEVRRRLRTLPLKPDQSLQTANIDMSQDAQLPEDVATSLAQVGEAYKLVDRLVKVKAYMASLGVYAWLPSKQGLVDALNDLSKYGWGMNEPPGVPPGLITRLGMGRTQGLNRQRDRPAGDMPHFANEGRPESGERRNPTFGGGYGSQNRESGFSRAPRTFNRDAGSSGRREGGFSGPITVAREEASMKKEEEDTPTVVSLTETANQAQGEDESEVPMEAGTSSLSPQVACA